MKKACTDEEWRRIKTRLDMGRMQFRRENEMANCGTCGQSVRKQANGRWSACACFREGN